MTDEQQPHLRPAGDPEDARQALEAALFEVKRVIVGQDGMLERVLVALLAGGHVLLEGVPGLAKTLTIKTVADVLGGTFKRIQFTPDLVPADLVGTRIYRPDTGGFDTELGPVFCNFLLADEINRAPAKVQSALLEVMQESQVTIGPQTHTVPAAVPGHGDAEPDRVRGHLPAARGAGRPLHVQGASSTTRPTSDELRGRRALARPGGRGRARAQPRGSCSRYQAPPRDVYVDPASCGTRCALTTGHARARAGRPGAPASYVEFGASPRGSINLVHAARALALLRGRDYVLPIDVADAGARRAAPPHRAHLRRAGRGGHAPRPMLDQVVEAVPMPRDELVSEWP